MKQPLGGTISSKHFRSDVPMLHVSCFPQVPHLEKLVSNQDNYDLRGYLGWGTYFALCLSLHVPVVVLKQMWEILINKHH